MACTKLIQNDIVLVSQPQVIRLFGDKAARLISQLHYWTSQETMGKVHDKQRWVFTTYNHIAETLCMSARHAKRIVSSLSEKGIVKVEKLSDYKSNRTNYYTLDYKKLMKFLEEANTATSIISQLGTSETGSLPHRDKMSLSECRDVTMVNTDNSNSELNTKSEEKGLKDLTQTPTTNSDRDDQVKQVKNINLNVVEKKTKEAKKTTIAQDMLAYWNHLFPKSKTEMSMKLAPLLVSAFKTKFNSEMIQWKQYCKSIESSSYLTREGFILTLQWVLKFETIERVRREELGAKNVPLPYSVSELTTQEETDIESLNESKEVKKLRLALLKKYGPDTYKSWFKGLELILVGNKITFKTESHFRKDWISQHYPELKAFEV